MTRKKKYTERSINVKQQQKTKPHKILLKIFKYLENKKIFLHSWFVVNIDKNKILKTGKYYAIVSFEFNEFTNNNPPFKDFSINIFCTSEDLSESLIEIESLRDPSKCIDFSLKFRYSKGVKKESTYLVGSSEWFQHYKSQYENGGSYLPLECRNRNGLYDGERRRIIVMFET